MISLYLLSFPFIIDSIQRNKDTILLFQKQSLCASFLLCLRLIATVYRWNNKRYIRYRIFLYKVLEDYNVSLSFSSSF